MSPGRFAPPSLTASRLHPERPRRTIGPVSPDCRARVSWACPGGVHAYAHGPPGGEPHAAHIACRRQGGRPRPHHNCARDPRRQAERQPRTPATGDWLIEPSELHRIYPPIAPPPPPPGATHAHARPIPRADPPGETKGETLHEVRARLADAHATIDDLRRRLDTAEAQERRRLTTVLSDMRAAPPPAAAPAPAPARRHGGRWGAARMTPELHRILRPCTPSRWSGRNSSRRSPAWSTASSRTAKPTHVRARPYRCGPHHPRRGREYRRFPRGPRCGGADDLPVSVDVNLAPTAAGREEGTSPGRNPQDGPARLNMRKAGVFPLECRALRRAWWRWR